MTRENRPFFWAAIMIALAAMTVVPFRMLAQDAGGDGIQPQTSLPDLVIPTVNAPSTAVQGAQIPISDVTSNQGAGYALSSFYDYIYLCTSSNGLSGSSCLIASHLITSLMVPGASVSWSGSFTIPDTAPLGTNFICDVADGTSIIKESNPNNNTNSVVIVITP
jgi:hypothetical protein